MSFLTTVILVLFILTCLFLIFLVLVQTSKGGSLFGSGGGSQSVFGSSTVDILTKMTRFAAIFFMILSLLLSYLFAKKEEGFIQPVKTDNAEELLLDDKKEQE